jgi:hypothetical protein
MKAFLLSVSGRILTVAFAIALASAGIGKLMGLAGLGLSSVGVLVAIAISIVALTMAVEEHFRSAALTVVLLPWLLFVGEVGQGLLPRSGGYALVALGCVTLLVALRPSKAAASNSSLELAHAG